MAAIPDEPSRVTLDAWLVTDIGMVRDHNEDSAYMDPPHGVFIVADGMGGHAAGEVASAMAVETVRTTLESSRAEIAAFTKAPTDAGRRSLVQLLQNAVLSAHQAVFQRGQAEQDKAGMGTTLDVVVVAGPEAFVAHVGDSRTYLIRDARTSQITTDHTVAEVLVIEGKLTIEEAQVSPLRTILVNAIGVSADVGVEMAHVTLKRGDRLLLCSDGLHDYFPLEDEIAERLSRDEPGDALKEMVELAKTRGGHDNITGVAIDILEVVDAVPAAMEAESTQPVEVPINPFAQDEPTETAFPTAAGGSPHVSAASLTRTQPMRAMSDEHLETQRHSMGRADTTPPKDGTGKKAKVVKASINSGAPTIDPDGKTEPAKNDATPTEISQADTGRVTLPVAAKSEDAETKVPVDGATDSPKVDELSAKPDEPVSAKTDAKADEKPDEKPAAKPDEPAATKPEAAKP
jgi:serine/threonine protein phosphatase PrpC